MCSVVSRINVLNGLKCWGQREDGQTAGNLTIDPCKSVTCCTVFESNVSTNSQSRVQVGHQVKRWPADLAVPGS